MQKTLQASYLSAPVLGVAATLVVIGMLLAFHSVVQSAVKVGEFRRQATLTQAQATGRCKMLRAPSARDRCLMQTLAATKAV